MKETLSSAFLDNVSSFHYPNKQLKKVGIFHTVYLTGICSNIRGFSFEANNKKI